MTRLLLAIAALALLLPACQADQDGAVSVSGTVLDEPFEGLSGVAEFSGGEYFVTLADDPNFTCTSSPFGDYRSVELFGIDGSGSFEAQGHVTFAEVVDDVIDQRAAQAGTIDITVRSDAGGEFVQGTIDASGPGSSVGGSFEVPVCD